MLKPCYKIWTPTPSQKSSFNWSHSKGNLVYLMAELRQPPSRAPYSYRKEKENHELIFSWLSWLVVLLVGAYEQRQRRRSRTRWWPYSSYCNRLTNMHSWFTEYFFDIGHPCYGQLTPFKTRYPLACITCPYRELKFEVDYWPSAAFGWHRGLRLMKV